MSVKTKRMNKLIIAILGIVGIGLLAWFVFAPGTTVMEQQFSIDEEIEELEAELVAIEVAVAAGTLTPEEAAEAQVRISARLEAISTVSSQAQSTATLSAAQRAQLRSGLERLRGVLVTYQATLQAVDEQALQLPEAERPQLFRGRSSVREAIEMVAEEVEVVAGGSSDVDVEVGVDGESEIEVTDDTVIPDVIEGEVVDEEDTSNESTEVEVEIEGEVQLDTATSN